jgi:hypothetical protein
MGATTVEVSTNHVAMVSHPDEVLQLIKTAAEAVPRRNLSAHSTSSLVRDRQSRAVLFRLHVALRLTAKLPSNPTMELTLVDWHDYHQVLTELPRAGGTRGADPVRIPLQHVLAKRVRFVQTMSGFDLAGRQLLTGAGPIGWSRLVLALGSRPNDFAIPGLAQRSLSLYSASDAERVWAAAQHSTHHATGVELAPDAARRSQPARPGA